MIELLELLQSRVLVLLARGVVAPFLGAVMDFPMRFSCGYAPRVLRRSLLNSPASNPVERPRWRLLRMGAGLQNAPPSSLWRTVTEPSLHPTGAQFRAAEVQGPEGLAGGGEVDESRCRGDGRPSRAILADLGERMMLKNPKLLPLTFRF